MKGTEGRKPWSLEMQIPHISVHLLAPVESESTVALIVNRMNARSVYDYHPIRIHHMFLLWKYFINTRSLNHISFSHCSIESATAAYVLFPLAIVSMSSE